METKNPRQRALAGASVSIAADTEASTRNPLTLQPIDDLARHRAMHLIQRFSLQPEVAAALAVLAFGGPR